MASHSVPEAARLSGRAARTLYKHIKAGKLSATRDAQGRQCVETSELIRVYGEIQDDTARISDQDAPQGVDVHELERLRAECARLEGLLHERDRVTHVLEQHNAQLQRLLEDRRDGRQRSGALGTLADALADRIRGK